MSSSLDKLSTPPEIAAGDRPPRQAGHRVGDRSSGDRCHWTRAWSPPAYLENPLADVSAHSSNPTAFVGRILTGLARSVKVPQPPVGEHCIPNIPRYYSPRFR